MDKTKPKISFIVATKDRADLLKETLSSLQAQNVPDWEAIVVDSGSDSTPEMILKLADPRIHHFKMQKPHGAGASCLRNFAAILAESDLIAIQDDDDLSKPNRIEVTLQAFKEQPDGDIFYASNKVLEDETGVIRDPKSPFTEFSLDILKERSFIPHSTVAIKKSVLMDFPYNQYFRLAEDYELYTRLAVAGKKFIFSREKIMIYRIHKNNISVGGDKIIKLRDYYGLVPRMMRGWIPYDYKIISEIERLENENSNSRGN